VAACLQHACVTVRTDGEGDNKALSEALPIVAIAIGTGAIEGQLRKILKQTSDTLASTATWHGVDPDPTSFQSQYPRDGIFLVPEAATGPDLLKLRPELAGECVLLMIWCDYDLDYDMEAIEQFRPRAVVCISADGCAGGPRFREWLERQPRAVDKQSTLISSTVESKSAATPAYTILFQKSYRHRYSQYSYGTNFLTWLAPRGVKILATAAADARLFPTPPTTSVTQ
jgi:hypothetical protein